MRTGQIVSRASSDVGLLQGLLSFLPLLTGNLVMLVVSVVVMATLSPLLTGVVLLIVPVLLGVAVRLRTTVFPAAWDAQQQAGEVASVVEEAVSGVRVVKAFGQEQRELGHLTDAARGLFRSRMRMVRIQSRPASALQSLPARALLVDPRILLLDEATSNLDLATEARVQRAMGAVAEGRTTLLIAHRLPTAATADRIVVLDGGRVVEDGTHADLVARNGVYADLWRAFAA